MKNIKPLIIIFMLLLSNSIFSAGDNTQAENLFKQANNFYSLGDYKKASELYEALIKEGVISENIYYNLGNSYYRMGSKGKAVVNYKKALKILPDDEDVVSNLKFVESLLEQKQPQEEYRLHERIFYFITNMFPLHVWFFILLFFYILVCVSVIFLYSGFKKGEKKYGFFISIIVAFFMSILFLYSSYKNTYIVKKGIIVSPAVEVRYSPSYTGAVAFKLKEGIEAQMVREYESWVYIRLTKKQSGWIEKKYIERI